MSRKNQKKEEEKSDGKLLTGLAVGFAAAAAGAAIGYFGRQLFSAWQESGQEEKQKISDEKGSPSCADKVAEDNAKEYERENHYRRHNQSVNVNNVLQMPVKIPPVSFHDQLMEYYRDYVDIPKSSHTAALNVVEDIRLTLSTRLRDPKLQQEHCLKVGDLVPIGSMSDGLSVFKPDRFDIMVPILLQANCEIKGLDTVGVVCIELEPDCSSSSYSGCDRLCDDSHRVVSRKLVECLLGPFQQACRDIRLRVTASLSNSSIVLAVEHLDGLPSMSINFVPAVMVGSKLYVPENDRSSVVAATDVDSSVRWRVSYARQEQWSIDRFDSSIVGHRMAVKILKAIRLNHMEMFGQISSYHIKNVLFQVLDDLPDSLDWHENAVGERLIDLLARLAHVLKEHRLQHYFEESVNLLSTVPKDDCINLAKFIEKKLGTNTLPSLLEKHC